MKNLLSDIMKLDLSKFSKPRGSSSKFSNQDSKRESSNKRKVHPSPATAKEICSGKVRLSSNQLQAKKRTTTETNNSPSNVRDEPHVPAPHKPDKSP